jgi:excinuclease UvrABC ATPase subunit
MIARGTPSVIKNDRQSLTGQYLAATRIDVPKRINRSTRKRSAASSSGASGNNLRR